MRGKGTVLHRWNGVDTWELVSSIYSINGGGRVHEEIEDDDLLDIGLDPADLYRSKLPGSKVLNDITIEVRWDPDPTGTNEDNQDLFEVDYDNSASALWRVTYTDSDASGEIWEAWVKELGYTEKLPNETVRRTITLTPTGELYVIQKNIAGYVPA